MTLLSKRCPKVNKWSKKKFGEIFFNAILAFIDGTFLVIVLMAVINIKASIDQKVPYDTSFVLSIISLLVYII